MSNLISVDLPAPFSPTSAIFSPGRSLSEMSRSTQMSEEGYLKETSRNSRACARTRGALSAGRRGGRSPPEVGARKAQELDMESPSSGRLPTEVKSDRIDC